jgi:general secretion pathway protein D
MRRRLFFSASPIAVGLCLTLSGCAAFPVLRTATSVSAGPQADQPVQSPAESAGETTQSNVDRFVLPARKPSNAASAGVSLEASADDIQKLVKPDETVSVSLPPQTIPQFLDTAFGEILKVPYSLGPNIGNRQEIITLRSSPDMPKAQFFGLLQTALRDYGIRLYVRDGAVMVLDDNGPSTEPALTIRSRSAKDTPESARSVIQFFQFHALESGSVEGLIKDLYPAGKSMAMRSEPVSNSLTISGSGRDVQGLVKFLQELDQPSFSGATVLRFEPIYWGVDAFAKGLEDSLTAEGFKVSRILTAPRAIMIMTLPTTGQVLVFVNDPDLVDRVTFWADGLDKPSRLSDQKAGFVYEVRNTSAAELGAMATGQGSDGSSTPQAPIGVAGTAPVSSQTASNTGRGVTGAAVATGGTISVDNLGNRILFTGTAAQFAVLRSLLEQLDKAPPQVMIEVTIAEVTLTDTTRLGLEWFFTKNAMGGTFSGGTQGKLGLGGSGILANYVGKDLRAAFNAFASNNKVNIISRPQLTTKSGVSARIQVGTDIPIITSQAASNVQTGGGTQVLQSVQYRQTGVILSVKPTVYGNNRVDLEISQEISKQAGESSGAIASPSILNRSLTTQISLVDGATHVLGGLMDDNFSKANQGIPFLKDIPLIGNAFRTDTVGGTKTELVLLVTPFILHDADDMAQLAEQMSGQMNRALRVGRGGSYTLTGISTGLNLGLNLPPSRTKPAGLNRKAPPVKKRPAKPSVASRPVQP